MASVQQRLCIMLGRGLDEEDQRLFAKLTGHLPAGALDDDGFLAEVACRIQALHEFRQITDDAANAARKRAEIDGEQHAMEIADKVWRRVMDHVPIDASHRLRRNLRIVSIWTAIVILIGAISGCELRQWRYDQYRMSTQAVTEASFNECLDAAEGRSLAPRSDKKSLLYDSSAFRENARTCAAEYADRRAVVP